MGIYMVGSNGDICKKRPEGRIRHGRPLIASSQPDEAPGLVPPTRRLRDYVNPIINASAHAVPTEGLNNPELVAPTRSLRDEEDPRLDASREAVPAGGVEESIQTDQHEVNEGDNTTVQAIKKRGRGPAKGTTFDRLRKIGKIPLIIKE
ncbi:uncharacterized protein LOC122316911 [Carya illinoinensis]|uniref:uncharacterized protein LOC122316911 n=1 Tax=Carya illinoinensis TaxID=32201 RepID=UPI001C720342|nr:uncharacterized protein LOC122316911 [Carya illinoinensis]